MNDLLREAELVAARIEAKGGWVSPDLRVWPDTAAHMLGRSVGTLANWRATLHPLRYVPGQRVSYRLVDLLAFIQSGERDSIDS